MRTRRQTVHPLLVWQLNAFADGDSPAGGLAAATPNVVGFLVGQASVLAIQLSTGVLLLQSVQQTPNVAPHMASPLRLGAMGPHVG